MSTDSEAYREYVTAAIALATSVDVADRMASDPSAPGDRGPAADAARDRMFRADLARYRAAKAAFDATLRAPQEPEPAMNVGAALRTLRERAGLSVEEAAALVGTGTYLADVESGKRTPTPGFAADVAKCLADVIAGTAAPTSDPVVWDSDPAGNLRIVGGVAGVW